MKLLTSYLDNRKQYVDGTKSEVKNITTGVPQGSIFGPHLFIIYINDIANVSKLFNFIIYADYTTLEITIEMVIRESNNISIEDKINNELHLIKEWLQLNKLSLNINKSNYMVFHMPPKNINPLQLKIEQIEIERVYEFNFLGLTINEHLNWRDHKDKISNKISKTLGLLNKLKHFLPKQAKLHIITHLYYRFLILIFWHGVTNVIEYINYKKRFCIFCISKYTEPPFKSLNLLKVSDILQLQLLKFYYK